jgi:hypothetical protein
VVLAPWVASLEDYCAWLRGLIDGSGGHLTVPPNGEPHFENAGIQVTVGDAEIVGLIVRNHEITFFDDVPHILRFHFEVFDLPDGTFEYGICKYHFYSADDPLIWRYDRHDGHPELGDWHVHLGSAANRIPSDAVDLDDVLIKVRAHFEDGTPLPLDA